VYSIVHSIASFEVDVHKGLKMKKKKKPMGTFFIHTLVVVVRSERVFFIQPLSQCPLR
jgi:hypothetical protein